MCICMYVISICYLYVSDAFTATIKMFIIAFLSEAWMLYFASGIGFLDSTSTTVMRSMIIGLVPVSEIGKVFCIVEFMKGILSFCGPIIYGKLYYYTVETTPQAFLYLSSSLKCLVFACSIVLYILLKNVLESKQSLGLFTNYVMRFLLYLTTHLPVFML